MQELAAQFVGHAQQLTVHHGYPLLTVLDLLLAMNMRLPYGFMVMRGQDQVHFWKPLVLVVRQGLEHSTVSVFDQTFGDAVVRSIRFFLMRPDEMPWIRPQVCTTDELHAQGEAVPLSSGQMFGEDARSGLEISLIGPIHHSLTGGALIISPLEVQRPGVNARLDGLLFGIEEQRYILLRRKVAYFDNGPFQHRLRRYGFEEVVDGFLAGTGKPTDVQQSTKSRHPSVSMTGEEPT